MTRARKGIATLESVPAKKKPVNSQAKGKRGELQVAKALTELGYPAERSQQRKGGAESPDVICEALRALAHRRGRPESMPSVLGLRWAANMRQQWARSPWWVRVLKRGLAPYWQTLPDFLADVER